MIQYDVNNPTEQMDSIIEYVLHQEIVKLKIKDKGDVVQMKLRSFLVTFGTLVTITGLLFLVGHMYSISWLMFDIETVANSSGFSITTGSYVPLIIGLVACFFAEKIYVRRYQENHN